MSPRVTRLANKRIREAGGHYDRSRKVYVLPAVAGVPAQELTNLDAAYAALQPRSEAIAKATGMRRPYAPSQW